VPFCRRAKDALDERGISYQTIELDELEGNQGNAIRATLGKKTKRTSVPSIFVRGTYIGGCNDGPGLMPLMESGELEKLLATK
jgi:glutaredoxin 3